MISSYAPTVRSLITAWRTRPAARPADPLVVGMPATPGLPGLPSVRAETEMLTARFPGRTLLTGPDAVRRAVLEALPRHPWAHFACHAVSAADGSADGHLVLHDHESEPLTVAAGFYARLGTPDDAATALHEAVRDLRSAHPESPAMWAPYIHVGP